MSLTDSCKSNTLAERVMYWLRQQVQKQDVQEFWKQDIVRPCLDSVMSVLIREYLQSILMVCVIWSILLAALVVLISMLVRSWWIQSAVVP